MTTKRGRAQIEFPDQTGDDMDLKEFMINQFNEMKNEIRDLRNTIEDFSKKIEILEEKNTALDVHVQFLSVKLNQLEQRDRDEGCKIKNLKLPEDVSQDPNKTMRFIYEKIGKNVMEKAVEAGDLSAVPDVYQVFKFGHIIPKNLNRTASALPPGLSNASKKIDTVILKFVNKNMKLIFFRHKRSVLEQYNTTNRSSIIFHDDLTASNSRCLFKLKSMAGVDSNTVHAYNGFIRFKKVDSDRMLKVLNPFASTLDEMTRLPVPDKRKHLLPGRLSSSSASE